MLHNRLFLTGMMALENPNFQYFLIKKPNLASINLLAFVQHFFSNDENGSQFFFDTLIILAIIIEVRNRKKTNDAIKVVNDSAVHEIKLYYDYNKSAHEKVQIQNIIQIVENVIKVVPEKRNRKSTTKG